MLCEECKVNEASYTISVMVGGEITTRHLCGDCMAKMNMDIASGNIKSLLSTILSAITGDTAPVSAGEQVVCPRCHLTLSEFTRTGHLGCPNCNPCCCKSMAVCSTRAGGPWPPPRISASVPRRKRSNGKWSRPWRWRTLKRRHSCGISCGHCLPTGRKKHE